MRRLTERDRSLIAFLAIARYLTSKQISRLIFPGRADSTLSERLNALAEVADTGAYLRRLSYRTYDGKVVVVWALSKMGYRVAQDVLGLDVKIPRRDIGADFLEHSITASQLFVFLAQKQNRTEAAELPTTFRWFSAEGQGYPFGEYDRAHGKTRDRLLQPDAVLDVIRERCRFFIELETGTHSIASANDEKTGSTLAKADRYAKFLLNFTDIATKQTFYSQAFPDGMRPEVLFVVTSPKRGENVNQALDQWGKARVGNVYSMRALTVADASRELRALIGAAPRITEERPSRPHTVAAMRPAPGPLLTMEQFQVLARCHREFIDIVHRQHELHRALARSGKVPEFPFEPYPRDLDTAGEIMDRLYRQFASAWDPDRADRG
jgi:hypothetical protein